MKWRRKRAVVPQLAHERDERHDVGRARGVRRRALELGARRLSELIGEYDADAVAAPMAEITERAERLMRAEVAALPDGTYSAEDWLDNDGIEDTPIRIALDLVIDGETITLDFSRSGAACAGPLNISRPTAIAT